MLLKALFKKYSNIPRNWKLRASVSRRNSSRQTPEITTDYFKRTLSEIMDRNNDATLEELCDLLEQQSGTRVSRATMGRITQNLNYSVKKKNTARCGERK